MRAEWGELRARQASGRKSYLEFLRQPSMSAGIYVIPVGGIDGQQPHHEDEVYFVVSGQGQFFNGDEDVPVNAGTFLYVPAHREHRFHSVTEDLQVLVVFSPAETMR